MQDPIHPSAPALRVRASLTAAFNMLIAEWHEILKIILVPYVLMMAGWLPVMVNFIPVMNSSAPPEPAVIQALFLQNIPWFILGGLISIVIYAYMVTALVQFFVLSARAQSWVLSYHANMWPYLWRRVMVSFSLFGASMGVILLTAILCAVLHPLTVLFIILGVLALLLVVSILATRLGLAPLAAALGEDDQLSTSWQRTRGQVVRISMVWLGFSLVIMCVGLASGLIEFVLGLLPGTLKIVLTVVKSTVVSGGIFAFAAALQAVVYVYFYGRSADLEKNSEGNSHVL